MKHNFVRYDQGQQFLLPKSIKDWIEDDSLEKYVYDLIDYLNQENRLKPFYPEERDDLRGRPRYHPVMLLKILIFGYTIGIRSSRKLDQLCHRDIAFRYLSANQQPDFRTISDFRKNHRQEFKHLFQEILELWREEGLTDLEKVALDGKKMQTDASLENNRTRQQIQEEIDEILDEADQTDSEEDEKYGPENRGDKLPKQLQEKEKRLEKLREAKKKLDKKEQELKKEQEEKIRQRREEEKNR